MSQCQAIKISIYRLRLVKLLTRHGLRVICIFVEMKFANVSQKPLLFINW